MELNYFDWEKKQIECGRNNSRFLTKASPVFYRRNSIKITYLPFLNRLGPIHNLSLLQT